MRRTESGQKDKERGGGETNREAMDRQTESGARNEQRRVGKETKGEGVKERTEMGKTEEQREGERDK